MRNIAIQLLVFFVIFQFLSFIKQTNMLATDTSMNDYQFILPTTVGETVSLNANTKTVIYFFAPWCSVCHASIENLQTIYQENQELNVVAVALDYVDENEINDFVAQHQLTFPVAFGTEQVKQAFKITAYPSYYVLDEQNTVISKSMGYSTEIGLYFRSL